MFTKALMPLVAGDRCRIDGSFEIGRRHRHAEEEALAAGDGGMHGLHRASVL
jgi:hypothetical protein